MVAASNPPAEDCYQIKRTISHNKLEYNHHKHIDLLWQENPDFILNETQSHFDEIKIICEFCSLNNIDFVVSLYLSGNWKILSGENYSEVINFIHEYNPLAISINCVRPDTFNKIDLKYINGFYLNCGFGSFTDKTISCGITPEEYKLLIRKYLLENIYFIGSCCGSSPLHTKSIKELLNELYRN